MILDELRNWSGRVIIDDTDYPSITDALKSRCVETEACQHIKLYNACKTRTERVILNDTSAVAVVITVKQYMTQKSTPSFDFMRKWNNDIPMPLRTMVGTVEKETPGMVYMHLHGDIISERANICMRCGREITNPVSMYFGLGPVCGNHNYINPFDSEDELKATVEMYRKEYLQKITWSGWIIKSAILNQEEYSSGKIV